MSFRIFLGTLFAGRFLLRVTFFIMSIVQFFAIIDYFEVWMNFHWIIAVPLALFTAGIPVVGTLLGMSGAVHAWDWSWSSAFLLFCGPFIVTFILAAIATLLAPK